MRRFRITVRNVAKNDWQRFNLRGWGVGIRGMRERVLQSHGELTIDSNALGTKITAIFEARTSAAKETRYDFTTRRRLIASSQESNSYDARLFAGMFIARAPCIEVSITRFYRTSPWPYANHT